MLKGVVNKGLRLIWLDCWCKQLAEFWAKIERAILCWHHPVLFLSERQVCGFQLTQEPTPQYAGCAPRVEFWKWYQNVKNVNRLDSMYCKGQAGQMQCVMERWRKIAWTSRCENLITNTEFGIIRRWFLLMGRWFTPLAGAADQARLAGKQTEPINLSICNFSERGRLQSDLIVLGLRRHSWCHHGGNCQVQRRSKMMMSTFLLKLLNKDGN